MRESILLSVWEEDESMARAQMRGSVRRTISHQLLRTAVSIWISVWDCEERGGGRYGGKNCED